jgi:thymidylate synthase
LRKELESLHKQIGEVGKANQAVNEQIDTILQLIEEDIQARATATQAWQYRFEEIASGRG